MSVAVSVLLSTHNPHAGRLRRTLDGLLNQSLHPSEWEIVLVDNASTPCLDARRLGLPRYAEARLVREDRLGLVYGRAAGFRAASGELVVFCDDDTVLGPDYLLCTTKAFTENQALGCAIGKSLPEFEAPPPPWTKEFFGCLGLWDHGNQELKAKAWSKAYPTFSGGGGGAAFRRAALEPFFRKISSTTGAAITGRAGRSLSSGEDNHLVLSVLKQGWEIAYIPELVMTHIIPPNRLDRAYLGHLNHGIAKSWVQVLALHDICPWKQAPSWSVRFRIWRAYFRYRAWAGPAEYVRWRGACGHFEGRATISSIKALANVS